MKVTNINTRQKNLARLNIPRMMSIIVRSNSLMRSRVRNTTPILLTISRQDLKNDKYSRWTNTEHAPDD